MKNKRNLLDLVLLILGISMLLLGKFILTDENVKSISGMCLGFGSAFFVLGIGNLIGNFTTSRLEDEKVKKFKDIEVNDERNIIIKEKSGYMASKIMNYIICILVLALGFMNVDKLIIFLVISLLLVEVVLFIGFSNYYSKRM
ncbi:hypothetical protein [Clostridium sp. 'White wine YQ']|uniref:hypothetical protein n=1 Tax=Clostridium sp. 'White wine YQ' TaxID=3027474 RepID=UPI002366AE5F|nr:hypothetical protein [Clostridium sp. 'White wine YQ']MDD7793372.1 hypothetical protein [Clostridium sp. 'White wine YQ']